jgi:hypothetical protein
MIDVNHPKMRLALHMADITGKQQAILHNSFGGYDIKPMSCVTFTERNFIMMVSPKVHVDEDHLEELSI